MKAKNKNNSYYLNLGAKLAIIFMIACVVVPVAFVYFCLVL